MESKLCNEEIIDMNTAKVKIEIDDFDFCEKEYVSDKVISKDLSFIAQKRRNTEVGNHKIINQKKCKEEFEELQNDKRKKIQTKNGIPENEFLICKEEYLGESDKEIIEIDSNNSYNQETSDKQKMCRVEFGKIGQAKNELKVQPVKVLKVQLIRSSNQVHTRVV